MYLLLFEFTKIQEHLVLSLSGRQLQLAGLGNKLPRICVFHLALISFLEYVWCSLVFVMLEGFIGLSC